MSMIERVHVCLFNVQFVHSVKCGWLGASERREYVM